MSTSDPFNSPGGFSVGIPPELVIDDTGNLVNNVNAPNANVTANRVFANSYLYANGQPLSIGASGSNTQVQYNNNGLLGASSSFTFNSATNLLTVTKLQVGSNANLGNISNVVILGGTNGYFLQTDGAGNLTWAPAGNGGNGGNGSPGGANTQVQFNDAGNFAGDAGFTYNKTTNILTVQEIDTGNIAANYIVTNWDVTANVVVANYLYGDGSNITNVHAIVSDVANSVAGSNVTGQVDFAAVANSVAGSNVTGQVSFANVANNVAAANIIGQVANALVAGTVYTANQPNITSVGNLTSLTVVGNTTLGNQVVSNYFIGNLFGLANLARNVTLSAQPNITSVGTLTSLTVSGNTLLGNNVTANYFTGNLYGVANSAIIANTANVATLANLATLANTANYANSALIADTANLAAVANSVAGANVTGQVANALVTGTVYTNAQPNITSVGTLSSLNVTTNITAGNVYANSGSIKAGYFVGPLATPNQPNITSVGILTALNVQGSANLGSVSNISITGGSNGYVLSTDGAGSLSWVAQSNASGNGTPGGSNTQVQYNNNGNFEGSSSFTYNESNKLLFVNGNANIANVLTASILKSNVATGTAPLVVTSTTPVANLAADTAASVRNNNQPNITSVGTLTTLVVSGNLSTGNISGGNLVSANYISGALITSSQPNITSVGTLTGLNVNGTMTAVNITANTGVFAGNANGLTNIPGSNVIGTVANAAYATNAGNASHATTANSATTAGTVTTAAQPNITSVGTLSSLSVIGNVLAGNLNANNVVTAANGAFYGNGSGLTALNASNISTGILSTARLSGSYDISVTTANTAATVTTNAQPNITSLGTLTSLGVNGNVTATNIVANTGVFVGNANGLTNIPAANISGVVANANYSANAGHAASATSATSATTAGTVTTAAQPNITSIGTLSQLNVTGNVLAGNLNANNVVTASNGAFYGNGSGLTAINASNISSGILSPARLSGTYNINVDQAETANTVTVAAQPNITSVGTLTGLTVSGVSNLGPISNLRITGGTNGYVLATDGTGNLSWTAQTGGNGNGTPGGATTQIQYNQDGSFAGSPRLSWNNTSNILNVTGNATITGYVSATVFTSGVSDGTAPLIVTSTTPVANLGVETSGTVRNAAQPNITSVGTLTGLNVTGNIVTNNFTANNNFTTNGNLITPLNVFANTGIVRGNLLTGTLTTSSQPNITTVGTLGNLTVNGNISAGNINAGNLLTANYITGTLTTNAQPNINYLGNVGWLNVNTSVPNSNGNITFNGSLTGTGVGSNITITGNVNAGNYIEANLLVGSLTTSAQPNITSIGTLTGLNVNGTSNLGNAGNVKITGGTNGYVLSTDGTGNLSWVAQSNGGGGNGTPGGSNTQIQFNNSGTFGGSAQLTFNDVTNQLTLVGNATITGNVVTNTITSLVTTGTAPLIINSTTPVANLAVETADTVRNSAQPNITSVGNLIALNVQGNVVVSNITVDNTFTTSGNIITSANIFANNGIVRGNLLTGTLTTGAQPNIVSVGTLTSLTVTGNVSSGNVSGGNLVSANYFTGTLTTNLQPNINQVGTLGYLNVDTSIANSNGNIRFNGSLSGVGAASNITITGNVNAGNYIQATQLIGSLTTSSQPNITTLGNLTTLRVLGNTDLGSVSNVKITGGTANYVLSTDGAGNLSWIAQSNGGGNTNPGGPNNSVQFNDGGILGGVAGFNFNKSTSNLSVAGNVTVTGLITGQTLKSNVATGSPPLQVNSTTPVANLAVETSDTVRNAAQPNITSVGALTSLQVAGNANITGAANISGTLTAANITTTGTIGTTSLNVTGTALLTGNTTVGNTTVSLGTKLIIAGGINANSSGNVTLGNISNIHIFGGINGYYLQTDGAGNLTWAPGGGGGGNGTPGGSNTQIQFNDEGEFGGQAGFTFNKTSNLLSVNSIALTSNLTANNISANLLTGTLTTNAQPNITSVGTLANLVVTGNVTAGNLIGTLSNGSSNISIPTANGNILVNVGGTSNVATISNIGLTTKNLSVTSNNIALGNNAGLINQDDKGIAIGYEAGQSNQGLQAIAIGARAGYTNQGINSIAIGANAAAGPGTVAIGYHAGDNATSYYDSVAVGFGAANINPGNYTVAVGYFAGNTNMGVGGTALGYGAGSSNQGSYSVALGFSTATHNQGGNAIAIGTQAGHTDQGTAAIAIGKFAGANSQANNSIILNATNFALDVSTANSFTVKPVRNFVNNNALFYNPVTGEITYDVLANYAANISANNINVSDNITSGNVYANSGTVSANLLAGTLTTAAQPNITSIGTLSSLNVIGNIATGNLNANAGTVYANYIAGNLLAGTITTQSQPNINNLGNLTSLTVGGFSTFYNDIYANSANILTSNVIAGNLSANSNVSAANINGTSGTFTNLGVTGNALISGNLTVNGNLIYVNVETLSVEDPIIELQVGPNGNPPVANSGKDVGTALNYFDTDARKAFMGWDVSAQEFIMAARSEINNEVVTVLQFGNLHIGNIIGNGQALTGLNGANVVGSVANAVYAETANNVNYANSANTANVAITVSGNAQPNITSVGTLANLAVTGNVNAGNVSGAFLTGTLTTNAQPNITSVGTLTGLTVNGISNLGSNANLKLSGGSAGQVLGTDGSGNLSWITGAGSPGGPNTAIQFNDGGVFGGNAFLTYNKVTNTVQISGNLIANGFQMGAGAFDFSSSNVYFATTNSAAADQEILNIPVSGLAAIDYTIISTDGSIRNFIKISVVRSGTSVNYVEYSTLPVNGYTGDYTVNYFAGNITTPACVQLKFSPQTANLMTHKLMVTTYKE